MNITDNHVLENRQKIQKNIQNNLIKKAAINIIKEIANDYPIGCIPKYWHDLVNKCDANVYIQDEECVWDDNGYLIEDNANNLIITIDNLLKTITND